MEYTESTGWRWWLKSMAPIWVPVVVGGVVLTAMRYSPDEIAKRQLAREAPPQAAVVRKSMYERIVPSACQRSIRSQLKDPDSMRIYGFTTAVIPDGVFAGQRAYMVNVGATNSFGAVVSSKWLARFDEVNGSCASGEYGN